MSDTLLSVLHERFNAQIDPDSNSGKILDTLTPLPPFDNAALEGQVSVASLAFVPTSSGLSVRAAQANDMLVWQIPDQIANFKIVPAQGADPLRVEVTLLPLNLPLPGLRPAQLDQDGMPQEAGNNLVKLVLPSLVLAVTKKSANLAAAQLGGGGLQVTMQPPLALIGPWYSAGLWLRPGDPQAGWAGGAADPGAIGPAFHLSSGDPGPADAWERQ